MQRKVGGLDLSNSQSLRSSAVFLQLLLQCRSFGSRRNSNLPQEFAGKEKNQFVKSICTHLNMVHCICHLQAKRINSDAAFDMQFAPYIFSYARNV
ncbi:hypothetical protein QYF36_015564 [Acer negundo]|nr:hypothetical protein QYF36_015564 [Acer negundo]